MLSFRRKCTTNIHDINISRNIREKNKPFKRHLLSKCIFNLIVLCTNPVIPSFVHVCIYFEWFHLWLFLELDSLLWNIVLEVSGPFHNLITRNYATNFNMNFLEVSLLLKKEKLFTSRRSLVNT